MSVKIGFLIVRNAYYKHFGTMIDEALKSGHEVFCFHDYSQPRHGNKGYQFPFLENMPGFRFGSAKAISYNNNIELLAAVEKHHIQVLITIHFLPQYFEVRRQLKKQGILWFSIQSVCDMLPNAEYMHLPDRYFVYSDAWFSLALHLLANQGIIKEQDIDYQKRKLEGRVKTFGFAELEQSEMLDSHQIKKDWGIPQDKKVVLLLPFTFNSSADRFWRPFVYEKNNLFIQTFLVFLYPVLYPLLAKRCPRLKQWLAFFGQVFRKENDKTLMLSLKKFCQKNNAYLLVKSRKKDPVKPYLTQIADKVLYDEEIYPSTIMKCMKIADLCCNFYSSAVLEASSMGVPSICISPKEDDWADVWYPLWELLFSKANDLHDFPGVSYKLGIPEAIRAFSERTLADFPLNKEKQKEYVEKYVGPLDGKYSSKVVKVIEILVNQAKIE